MTCSAFEKSGFVDGVSPVSERRWRELERSSLPPNAFFVAEDGIRRELQLPPLDEYDEDDETWPEFDSGGLIVTASGRSQVSSLLAEESNELVILGDRIQKLIELAFFDTAVREACVGIEHRIKTWLNSDGWGDALVEEFISHLREGGHYTNPWMCALRGQIRILFKFIRNDFMHNFVDVDETQCCAILLRVARVRVVVDQRIADA